MTTSIRTAHDELPAPEGPSPSLVALLASVCGLAVATLYYSQPMLAVMGAGLRASDRALGLVPMLTQLGYALGILLLAPLGDRVDRRRIVIIKAAVLSAALLGSALAPDIGVLLGASLVVGLTATLAQDVVSASASLTPEARRGRVVGAVMTGLLMGVLLSRVVSGLVAERYGWRAMYAAAAVSLAAVVVLAWRAMPSIRSTTSLPYGALLRSITGLWRDHPALRRAAMAQGLLAVGFSAFWSSLALMLHRAPFHLGSAVAGAFGVAGAVGAIAAPMAGRLADRRGPELVTRLGSSLAAVSFGAMAFAPLLAPRAQLGLIAASVVGFDLGVQATLIAHQTLVYGLDPGARSRLNAVLFVGMFAGMSAGAGLGSVLLAQWGWLAVTLLATLTSVGALLLRLGSDGITAPRAAA
ncbi:MAG: MFS transporter [Deltaproteobacteria bacterium]|nr:MFS transporter [Myxococcales bacterium]MDP3217556.1 MFS transporter [Deltaproteobacteria bacterium]